MTRPNLTWQLQRFLSLTGALVGLVPLLGAVAPLSTSTANNQLVLPRMANDDDTHAASPLQSAQSSVTSTLQDGIWVGHCRFKLNVTPSNVGISWQLPLE
jgi:hypothetical protein